MAGHAYVGYGGKLKLLLEEEVVADAMVGGLEVTGPDTDAGLLELTLVLLGLQRPYCDWHPAPQYASVLPQ